MRRIRETREPWRVRLGRRAWGSLHRLAASWPCRRCRPNMRVWMEGFHDAINVRRGKPLFQAVSYGRFATGELAGRYHPACIACFFTRAALRRIYGGGSGEGGNEPSPGPSPVGAKGAQGNGSEKGKPYGDNPSPPHRGGRAMSEVWLPSGDSGVTLHVLRLPTALGDGSRTVQAIEDVPTVLQEAMGDADREYLRVFAEAQEAFYYRVATPSVRQIDSQSADLLRTSLQLSEVAVGVLGPGIVGRGEAHYRVWIRLRLCG